MKNIKVEILEMFTPKTVLTALSMPYENDKASIALLKKVCLGETRFSEKHGSVLEHIPISFIIDGSSRLELQEHMRHRIASSTVKSTRYTLKPMLEKAKKGYLTENEVKQYFIIPDGLSMRDICSLSSYYSDCAVIMAQRYYDGWTFDQIKYHLPEGFRTRFVWTINFRSLLNFFRLRLEKDAHFEIRRISELALAECNKTWLGEVLDSAQ